MYKALVEKATRNKELSKTKEQTLLRNVYFLMDEFGNLPKMHKMDTIVTVGRSRHIYMVPVIQDFNQLDEKYGKEVAATIRSNCNIQIFIGSNDENTRKIISEACGKKKVKQISYSDFCYIKIPCPSLQEQNAIANVFVSCDNEISLAKQKLNVFQQQKKGLMQVLLTGKKRVKQ